MFWLAYFPSKKHQTFVNRRECSKTQQQRTQWNISLGCWNRNSKWFFLAASYTSKRTLSTFMMLKRNSATLLQHSLPRAVQFLHLLAWSKALISSQNLLFWIVDSPGWHLAVQSRVTCDIWCGMVCLKNEIFQQRLVSQPLLNGF